MHKLDFFYVRVIDKCMLSYRKVIPAIALSALTFHTIWVIPAFIYFKNNALAGHIFELLHTGARFGTLSGYLISDLWVVIFASSAGLIYVFFYNLLQMIDH